MHPRWLRCSSLKYPRYSQSVAPCHRGASPFSMRRWTCTRPARMAATLDTNETDSRPYGGMTVATVAPRAQTSTGELGTINFPTSAKPAAQAPFLVGTKALYNFEFDIAAEAFQQSQKADPGFALGVLGRGDELQPPAVGAAGSGRRAARARAARADGRGPRREGAGGQGTRSRSKSLEVLFGAGDKLARDIAYAGAHGASSTRSIRRTTRSRACMRWRCSAPDVPASATRATRCRRRRSRRRSSSATRSTRARRITSSTRSTIPITPS